MATMTAARKNEMLSAQIETRTGVWIGWDDANTLRRAELTLSRWAESYCNGDIEPDDENHATWSSYYNNPRTGERRKIGPAPNRERGALKRVAEVCERRGLHYRHQTDPRGASLYVDTTPFAPHSSDGIAAA